MASLLSSSLLLSNVVSLFNQKLSSTSSSMEELKAFSLSEISLHSSITDCWVLINGKVYDVTSFLEDHPGGEAILLEAAANGDATKAFAETGHTSTATSMMSSYLIGVLENTDSSNDIRIQQSSEVAKERDIFAATRTTQGRKSSASMSLFQLVTIIMAVMAFGVLYFLVETKS